MGAAEMAEWTEQVSPRFRARLAGVFEALEGITSSFGQVAVLGRLVVFSNAAATAALLYHLFKPVNRSLSLVAAFLSLGGCAILMVGSFFQEVPLVVLGGSKYLSVFNAQQLQALAYMLLGFTGQAANLSLVFFGPFDFLIGYLIFRSTFLPRILGVLMMLASLGWLAFLAPRVANHLSLYSEGLGILAEGLLMLWLLVMGVNAERWKEQASAAGMRA